MMAPSNGVHMNAPPPCGIHDLVSRKSFFSGFSLEIRLYDRLKHQLLFDRYFHTFPPTGRLRMRPPFRASVYDWLQNGSCHCHLSRTCEKLTRPTQLTPFTSPYRRKEACSQSWYAVRPSTKMPQNTLLSRYGHVISFSPPCYFYSRIHSFKIHQWSLLMQIKACTPLSWMRGSYFFRGERIQKYIMLKSWSNIK